MGGQRGQSGQPIRPPDTRIGQIDCKSLAMKLTWRLNLAEDGAVGKIDAKYA